MGVAVGKSKCRGSTPTQSDETAINGAQAGWMGHLTRKYRYPTLLWQMAGELTCANIAAT
jgi:hypothetical protein